MKMFQTRVALTNSEVDMFQEYLFDDGRGRYPDRISAPTPMGLREAARAAAASNGLSLGEFVRRALISAVADPSITAAPVASVQPSQPAGN
jgi:hypothetical protein